MRAPSEDLYQLIQCLSKEEKKKVTIHFKGLGKKGEEYIRLFNRIVRQKTYDENALKDAFRGSSFSIAKKRMYELIMDVLLLLFDSNAYDQILKGLLSFEILYQKKLYKKARKLIYELEELAEKYDLFFFLHIINERMKRLEVDTYKYSHFNEASFNEFIQKKELNGLIIYNTGQYMALQDKLLYVIKKSGNNWKNEIELFLENPLLLDINCTEGLMSEALFYNINQIIFSLKQDREKLIFFTLKQVSFFEEHYKNIRPEQYYIQSLLNAARSIAYTKDCNEVERLLKKVDSEFLFLKDRIAVLFKEKIVVFKIWYYGIIGDLEQGTKLIEKESKWLLDQKATIELVVFYSIAYLHFLSGNYKAALNWLNEIESESHREGQGRKNWRLILTTIIYLECDMISLAESQIRSLDRKLRLIEGEYDMEFTILKALRKILSATNKKEELLILKNLQVDLKVITNALISNRMVLLDWFDFFSWIEGKLRGVSMVTILTKKVELIKE